MALDPERKDGSVLVPITADRLAAHLIRAGFAVMKIECGPAEVP